MERLLIAGSLLLGSAAFGCGDDDDPPDTGDDMDSGTPMDGGGGNDARTDSGKDSGGNTDLPTMTCGTETCEGVVIANNTVRPCCVEADEGCGLDADDIKKASPASPFTGCVPRDVAAAHASEYCGAFFDQIEPEGDHENGGLDIKSGVRFAVFEGCCLPTGECGADISVPRGADEELNSHLGCVSFNRLKEAFAEGSDGGTQETPDNLPFCNPANGEAPSEGTVPGVPSFVCGCGADVVDDGEGLPCLNKLAPAVCGKDEPTEEILADVPEFMCGCTADSKLPCLRNVAAATCGGKEIDTDSAELAEIPEFICGAGSTPSPFPTLPNVEPTVCGKAPVTAGSPSIAEIPALICGCDGATAQNGYPCLTNVAHDVCGASLVTIPEFVVGCGATTALGATERLCIPFAAPTVHGEKPTEVDETNHCLLEVPEYALGCGASTPSAQNPCIPGVPQYFGCDEVTSGTVRGAPDYICGCGDEVPYTPATRAFTCVSNVPKEVCGAIPVPVNPVPNVPEFVCGCGENAYYLNIGAPCLAKKPTTTCGALNAAVGTRDFGGGPVACLAGIAGVAAIPEYATGCGDGAAGLPLSAADTCLPHAGDPNASSPTAPASRLFGCADITTSPPNVFEYICGCGQTNVYTGATDPDGPVPCLSFVDPTVCGSFPVTTAAGLLPTLQNLPKTFCGCGDGQKDDNVQSLPCLPNIPRNVCAPGAAPINPGTSDPGDECVVGYPQVVHGCGTDVTAPSYPIQCIPNVAATLAGCPT